MDKITLAHIGGELVIIGGVAFYFHRKTVKMTDRITALEQENAELKEAIQALNDSLQELGMIVMQMRGAKMQQAAASQQSPMAPIIMSMMPPIHQNKVTEKAIKKPILKKPSLPVKPARKTVGDDSGDETLDEADLDKELEPELSQLNKERKDPSATIAKVNCDDGVCKLVDDE